MRAPPTGLLIVLTACAQPWKPATPWTLAYQAPPSVEYWSGLTFPTSVYSFLHNIIQIIFSFSYWIFDIFLGKRTIHIHSHFEILFLVFVLLSCRNTYIFLYILHRSFIRHSLIFSPIKIFSPILWAAFSFLDGICLHHRSFFYFDDTHFFIYCLLLLM